MTWAHSIVCTCDDCGLSLAAAVPATATDRPDPPRPQVPDGWLEVPRYIDAFNEREPRRHFCPAHRKYHVHER